MNIDTYVDKSGEIYFSTESQAHSQYAGNVYKVIGASSAAEKMSNNNKLLSCLCKIASDDNSNPVVIYSKYISETEGYEEHFEGYDSGEWEEIAGDYSSSAAPADIELNGELYFVYGDGNDLLNYYPTTFKALSLKH